MQLGASAILRKVWILSLACCPDPFHLNLIWPDNSHIHDCRWWRPQFCPNQVQSAKTKSLDLETVSGMYLVILGGIVISAILCLAQYCLAKGRIKKVRTQVKVRGLWYTQVSGELTCLLVKFRLLTIAFSSKSVVSEWMKVSDVLRSVVKTLHDEEPCRVDCVAKRFRWLHCLMYAEICFEASNILKMSKFWMKSSF